MKETMREDQEEMEGTGSRRSGSRLVWWIVLGAIVIAALVWFSGAATLSGGGEYQAVFLTNDQVYFGRLLRADSQYPVLRDVYYLQVTQVLQPSNPNSPGTNVNLVKLGGELHGPEDAMYLNRDQILFYEDLKGDSQVVLAIESFKANQEQ